MTRWFLFFFALVLPLQFAWSASAAYCGHESAPLAFHLGHHAHVHGNADVQDAAGPQEAAGAPLTMAHSDCSYCHACGVQMLMNMPGVSEMPYGHSIGPVPCRLYAFRVEPDIERPKWLRAR